MALTSRVLASGPGWRAQDVICSCGPRDRIFEEEHDAGCIAIVTAGTFRYRSTVGSAVLAPGALLLGNRGHSFECSHDHSTGDRCLSFKFAPEFLEDVAAAVPGARQVAFGLPRLPPRPDLLPVVAAAEAARDDGDAAELEEIALRLAGAVAATLAGPARGPAAPSRSDERRISAALHRVERDAHQPLSLADLAGVAAMSPNHFCDFPCGRWDDAAPVHPAYAASPRRGGPTPHGRQHFGHRVRGWLQRSIDVQSPICAHHGRESGRLPGVGRAVVKRRGGVAAPQLLRKSAITWDGHRSSESQLGL